MAARHQHRAPVQTPDLCLSDSEDCYSSSEDELSERDQTDHLLRQAHHYVITEGGNDSPTTYMERIQRINRSLLQEISIQGYDCDAKLYRRVKQKVDHVLREFEDVMDADSSACDFEGMPEYYTAAAEEALYRMDSSPVMADVPSIRHSKQLNAKDDVERTYLYGGPDNHPEIWYKKAAASLPFPETIRIADWESVRIHWDLATTGNMDYTEPVTSTGVSFNDPLLAHHNNLTQYESGSRFKLPAIEPSNMAKVNKIGTVDRLHEAVAAFSQGDNTTKRNGEYKYAPRVFLDRLEVDQQVSPQMLVDEVRRAVNATPTKPRPSSSDSSKIGCTPAATRALLNQQQPSSISKGEDVASHTIEGGHFDDLPVTTSISHNSPSRPRTAIPEPSPHNNHATSSAIRRIKAATEASIRSSPLPQSPPAQSEITKTQVVSQVLIPAKRSRGRPRKNPLPAATVPAYQTTAIGKRKRLSVDAAEEEVEEEVKVVDVMPAKRKRTNPPTSERHTSVREQRGEATRPSTPTLVNDPSTPVVTPGMTPVSLGTSVASTPPVAKARAAGKQKRKIRTKRDYEERVTPEKYEEMMAGRRKGVVAEGHESVIRGSTRSGRLRAI